MKHENNTNTKLTIQIVHFYHDKYVNNKVVLKSLNCLSYHAVLYTLYHCNVTQGGEVGRGQRLSAGPDDEQRVKREMLMFLA